MIVASFVPAECPEGGGMWGIYIEKGYLEHPESACCTDSMFEIFVFFGQCLCCLLAVFVNRQPPCPDTTRGLALAGTRPQRGGGGGNPPPSTDPKIVARNSVLCRRRRRRRFCFRHTAGGNFFVSPYVSILKILRFLWRIQKWLKSTMLLEAPLLPSLLYITTPLSP